MAIARVELKYLSAVEREQSKALPVPANVRRGYCARSWLRRGRVHRVGRRGPLVFFDSALVALCALQ
jgi:hypothetical protein